MLSLSRLAIAARVFSLAAIVGLVFTLSDGSSAPGLVMVCAVALLASLVTPTGTVSPTWVTVAEALLVAVLIGSNLTDYAVLVPYLATPALISGLYAGVRGVSFVLGSELVALILVSSLTDAPLHLQLEILFTGVITGLGMGLLGSYVRSAYLRSTVADESYRGARQLLSQLRALSGNLTAGLDPLSIADKILGTARDDLGAQQGAVFIRTASGVVTPLRYSDGARVEDFYDADDLVQACWHKHDPIRSGDRWGLPLRVDSAIIAVLVVDCAEPPGEELLAESVHGFEPDSLRLDTALLFDEVRAEATNEERQRLAREVHDGAAQDVASLGYLIDDLNATATDDEQRGQIKELRQALSKVVAELRLSVFDLRNQAHSTDGLGSSLSAFARQIGSHSSMTVHLTLDEGSTRLRPDVEAECLRIAQEAMNNARKHSQAKNLWIACTVHPPFAKIVITDDGNGLGAPRDDSHGLRIMQERADRIGAELTITGASESSHRGTRLTLRIGNPSVSEGLEFVMARRRKV